MEITKIQLEIDGKKIYKLQTNDLKQYHLYQTIFELLNEYGVEQIQKAIKIVLDDSESKSTFVP